MVGGGIGGLTAALAFALRGANVEVFEQAAEIAEVGAGIQITPNGARVLDELGITPMGITAEAVVPTDGLSGKAITRFDLSRKSPPYRFVHRSGLIDQLMLACQDAGARISLNAHISSAPSGYDLVIGADGIRSRLRSQINAPKAPSFTGQVAWRAIIEGEANPEARIWMMPGAHVVTYPLTKNRINIVAVQERQEWAEEGWSHADTAENLQAAFSNASSALQEILQAVQSPNLWGLFRHPVAPLWHKSNIVLLGDAAHPTLPFLAQGANLAIEDAYVLAKCCDEMALDAALRRYTQLRVPRVTRAIAAANANSKNYHLRGTARSMSFLALQTIGALAPNAFLNRLNWLYEHDVTS